MNAIKLAEKPPMYWEAVRYLEEYRKRLNERDGGPSPEEIEKARVMLAVRAFQERSAPYFRQLAWLEALDTPRWFIDGDTITRSESSPEFQAARAAIQRMIDIEAERLGLTVPARPST